ncbi:class I SAM-dependent methyltransferase [Rubrimonas cliftonensis]|uniref:Methyltransferase domain-containing protein n=1 Tax=Rubrimonas cliftonensis TaxID=89524 RepID=A0A1H4G711_9RHOB|nr:class I SAM-dependent methyltransferase [Rubrimonas cliftonensis]SEB05379.1 Methyltransferase domain-containing protein [Rubrimonas cliftonensis]
MANPVRPDQGRPCRFCGAPLSLTMADLGHMPFANDFLPDNPAAIAAERRHPLHARVCEGCWLAQLDHDAPADAIFVHDYAYLSSYSDSWVAHAKAYAEAMTARFGLGPHSLVMEAASNDGYLLQHFSAAGVPVLGVEPAGHAAGLAVARGVPTRVCFFNAGTAARLSGEGLSADLIAANNVLAHVPDITDFVAGFPVMLAPQGVATFEFPHLLRQLQGLQFDTIYHEHYSYLSLAAVERIFAASGLRVFDVEALPTHGGSLRVFACREGAAHAETRAVAAARAEEAAFGIETAAPYRAFSDRVRRFTDAARKTLIAMRDRGDRLAAYGAAAKGVTFLNQLGLGADVFMAVADRNPGKQGRLMPGAHVPIIAPEALAGLRPDLVLILPWNLRAEIAATLAPLRAAGARFAVADANHPDGVATL